MTLPIIIASYLHAEQLLANWGPEFSHVISINDPQTPPPPSLREHQGSHLILKFYDLSEEVPGYQLPQPQDTENILEFAKGLTTETRVLIHCAAGISRSSATALTILASRLPPSAESAQTAVERVLAIKPSIFPNARMVQFADDLLEYRGELKAAYETKFHGYEDTLMSLLDEEIL